MKVLMTTDTVGGVWTFALQLAKTLGRHGVAIDLATLGSLGESQRRAAELLPNVSVHESGFRLEWMEEPWEDVRAAALWLLRLAEETCPDVVHLNEYSHGARPWPAPVLITGHSCVLSWHRAVRGVPAGPEWNMYRDKVTEGLRGADLVVAPTAAMLDSLMSDYGPFAESAVISNGRDEIVERPHPKQPFVLTAGRLWDEAKNMALLDAAASKVSWPIYAAGDVAHPGGHSVSFPGLHALGRLKPALMQHWFQAATIYAHPARYEPFGLAPLEAAQCGCALVLGDIPTLREVWGDAALFVSPDRPEELSSTLNCLIEDPALCREFAERARLRAARYTAERMAGEYLKQYRRLAHVPVGASDDVEAARSAPILAS